jgi:hypothetical protein
MEKTENKFIIFQKKETSSFINNLKTYLYGKI